MLPCLIQDGLLSDVDDIRMQTIHVLMDLAKEAGPALKPHLTEFICVLLESLSGLESPMLNYLAARLSKESGNQDRLDDARLQMAKSSPITDTIDSLIKYIDAGILETLVPRLVEMIKKGIGQSTKAGCARLVEQLARQCGQELHPHAKALLKAMLSAARGKSAPVRRDFANAIGHFVRASPPGDVDMIVKRCRKMYIARESDDYIEASATICKAIARYAPDVLAAVATQVLPLAFIGMYDPSTIVQKVWKEVWTSNTGGDEGGIRLYVPNADRSKHQPVGFVRSYALSVHIHTQSLSLASLFVHPLPLSRSLSRSLGGRPPPAFHDVGVLSMPPTH